MRFTPINALSLALLALCLTAASPALAQDADLDGVPDALDAFPCDDGAAALLFAPAEGVSGTLLFEDNWPARGDLDFNDVALGYNYVLELDVGGGVRRLRATLDAVAVGGSIQSGLGLVLPVDASAVSRVTRRIGAGAPEVLTPTADAQLTVVVLDDVRALFDGAAGVINARADQPRLDGGRVVVEVEFEPAVTLSTARVPYDLFIFRSQDPSHEIHRPEYAGTSAMNAALFGSADDGSTPTRRFVDTAGLPFALSFPGTVEYPAESLEIAALYPRVLAFAASGGEQARDFYLSPIETAVAYRDVAGLARLDPRALATTDRDASCIPVCSAVEHLEANVCTSDTRSCAVAHGTGTQAWNGSGYDACTLVACDAGYRAVEGACVLITYAWSAGAWSTCSGASGSPSYGSYGTCSGGSGTWSYGSWGTCSATAVCGGAGTQSRSASCAFAAGSGSQSRTGACAWDAGSGTQARTLTCQNNFGETVSGALCTSMAPVGMQACTPAGAPASCGTLVTTQACTPTNTAVCGGSVVSQACASPSGSRACSVGNGTGTQSCAAGGTSWGACSATACNSGYHLDGAACVSNTQSCTIANGTGTQTWTGSAWGTCTVVSCNAGYDTTGTACVSARRLVFVTTGNYNGNLGGLAGADAICQSHATSANLPGTYRAWLSSSASSATARLTHATVPYRLVDGTLIANNWTDLTDGTLAAPISRTEVGVNKVYWVWTGSSVSGSPYSNMPCSNWTSGTSLAGGNFVGRSGQTNCRWTNASANNPDGGDCTTTSTTLHCTNAFALYCLQQ